MVEQIFGSKAACRYPRLLLRHHSSPQWSFLVSTIIESFRLVRDTQIAVLLISLSVQYFQGQSYPRQSNLGGLLLIRRWLSRSTRRVCTGK
jgi:hypothetical protein